MPKFQAAGISQRQLPEGAPNVSFVSGIQGVIGWGNFRREVLKQSLSAITLYCLFWGSSHSGVRVHGGRMMTDDPGGVAEEWPIMLSDAGRVNTLRSTIKAVQVDRGAIKKWLESRITLRT